MVAGDILGSGTFQADGDTGAVDRLTELIDTFDPLFNLVTP